MKKLLFLLLMCSVSLVNAQGSVSLQFENFVGNEPVVLKDKNYTNATGEQFNITLLYFYVSNLRLVRKDGSEYIVPQDESYFLIRENKPETKTITLNNIPKGTYTGVKFVIGIDSVRSASDVSQRKGCLDVGGDGKDMYWAWNSGYIFVKMEGTSPQIDRKDPVFMYHIGLFGGIGDKKTLNNIRIADINFGEKALKIKSKGNAVIGIKTDVSRIMNGETNVSMAKNPVVMGGPYSAKITENYKTMFSFAGFKKELTAQPNSKVALGMN